MRNKPSIDFMEIFRAMVLGARRRTWKRYVEKFLLMDEKQRVRLILLTALLLFCVLLQSWLSQERINGIANVVDGDSIKIGDKRIRLHGIDAPEYKQNCYTEGEEWACGEEAFKSLYGRIHGKNVSCDVLDTDRYKRSIAVCYENGEDINSWMVSQGWAIAYTYYTDRYADEEKQAKAQTLNIWKSEFLEPYRWRKGERIE